MLTTLSNSSPRARSLRAKASAMMILEPTNAALIRSWHYRQARGFRFGLWRSYCDPEYHREPNHRHRILRYKYMESATRKVSWDPRPHAEDPKVMIQRIVGRYWHGQRTGGKYVNLDEIKSTMDDTSGTRPGRNIEDVERSAMDHLFSGNKNAAYEYDMWQSPLQNIRNYLAAQMPQTAKTANAARSAGCWTSRKEKKRKAAKAEPNPEPEYTIDPITNRKVFSTAKTPSIDPDTDITMKAFKPDSADHKDLKASAPPDVAKPVHSDGPPPADELRKYRKVKIDANPSDNIKWINQNSIFADHYHATLPQPGPDNRGHGSRSDLPETNIQPPKYEDPDGYRAANEREAGVLGDVESKCQDLGGYGPVVMKEASATENSSGGSADLHKYRPVAWSEPDGQWLLTSEEQSKDSDDLHKYGPVRWNEPHGLPTSQAEEEAKEYRDPTWHRPSMQSEPNGIPSLYPEVVSKQYGDVSQYHPFIHNEPDGLPAQKADEADQNGELKGQPTVLPDPAIKNLSQFDASVQAAEREAAKLLERCFGQSALSPFGPGPEKLEDVETLTASDVRASVGINRDTHGPVIESGIDYTGKPSDSADAEAHACFEDVQSKTAREEQPESLDNIDMSRPNLTGKQIQDFPEDFVASWSIEDPHPSAPPYSPATTTGTGDMDVETEAETVSKAETQSREGEDLGFSSFDEAFPRLETALDRQSWATEPTNPQERLQTHVDPYSTKPQGLQTSFAEECNGKPTLPVYVKTYGDTQSDASAQIEPLQETSHTPEQQTAQDRELVNEIRHIYEESCGKIVTGDRPVTSETPVTPVESVSPEPTMYKILAYDPTMQTIKTAQTTSIVPDSTTALPPAEVLLRLSNPSKFFPHFESLQAEGYEIISGSGDVLVFRKVRDAQHIPGEEASPSPKTPNTTTASTGAHRVNPIDMMGSRPISSVNFANPTGFVNYNEPGKVGAAAGSKPPPPFRPRIDVRREEPVFSGQKTEQKRVKKSLGRRMLAGVAYIVGASYAVGVVLEYFKTGGIDGVGPKRL